jgi:DNA-binding NtrC family response regulator
MTGLWIVHRDPTRRAALARLAAAPHALVAAPLDRSFDGAPEPDAVVLGLAGDFELELEFAHRLAPRLTRASWLLVCEPGDLSEARRLFDTLPADWLRYPPDPARLRGLVWGAGTRRRTEPLSERRNRDALAARFARWLGDLELPELLPAFDPHFARVPLLVRGEPGTGRGLLARYLHAFGGTTGGSFLSVPCAEVRQLDDIAREIERVAARRPPPPSLTICLEDVDDIARSLRRELRAWIELAPPVAVPHSMFVRWIGTAGPRDAEDPSPRCELEDALAGITIQLPPLRERLDALHRFVTETASAWAFHSGERPRHFSDAALAALQEYPWPGNLRELESVVLRALATDSSDPVPAASLRFGDAPWPRAEGASEGAGRRERSAPTPAAIPVVPVSRASAATEERLPPAVIVEERPAQGAPIEGRPAARASTRAGQTTSEREGLERRLLGALAHEIRNPLVPIRTLADLLPQASDDPEFRARFASRVGADVRRIEGVLDRLSQFAALEAPRREPVDVSSILDALLEAHRDDIQTRRLLVLKELDRSQPHARTDPDHLRLALEGLVARVLSLVPERGDLYLASKHHAAGERGEGSVRVLLRYHSPHGITPGVTPRGVSVSENSLEILLAEAIVADLGGRLTIDETESDETVIVLDLPA